MVVNTVTEAKAQLSSLIEKVIAGEQVIIRRAGKPVAVLSAYVEGTAERRPGALAGRVVVAPDFDELPDELERAFGMKP